MSTEFPLPENAPYWTAIMRVFQIEALLDPETLITGMNQPWQRLTEYLFRPGTGEEHWANPERSVLIWQGETPADVETLATLCAAVEETELQLNSISTKLDLGVDASLDLLTEGTEVFCQCNLTLTTPTQNISSLARYRESLLERAADVTRYEYVAALAKNFNLAFQCL